MVGITELGYIGIGISNEAAWKEYAAAVIGMEVWDGERDDRFYLRLDNWHHRIVAHKDGSDDLLYLGWRVAGRKQFEEMQDQLAAAGLEFRQGTREEAEERHVLELLKLTDPAGIQTEIFYGPEVCMNRPFHPGRPLHGRFLTGNAGLGHCIVAQPDHEAAYRFYSALGFEGGVEVKIGPPEVPVYAELTFMHCNERQHSIAWGAPGAANKMMNHLMIEYDDVKDLGAAHDRVRERQIAVAMNLGIHANDRVLSFYAVNPSGWLIELGASVGQPFPSQSEYYRADIFGHKVEKAGFIFAERE